MRNKEQIAYDNAGRWYEEWAERYNQALNFTYPQNSDLQLALQDGYGYFRPYDEDIMPITPNTVAKIEAAGIRVRHVYDIDRNNPLTAEQLHKKAMSRLRKIEKKLVEWGEKYKKTRRDYYLIFR